MRLKIRDSEPPVGDELITEIESRLGLALPADYRMFLLMHNGGIPRRAWFHLGGQHRLLSAPQSRGSLWWFGQKYGNESMRRARRDWHRVSRILGVAARAGADPTRLDFERAYRDRPPARPVHLAPIATVEGFNADGCLCLDISPDGSGRGRVFYWSDDPADAGRQEPVPVANSFDALLEILNFPGKGPPEWLSLVQDGDLRGLRQWIGSNISRVREKDEWDWTALDHAVFEGRWEIVDYLLEKRNATPGMILYDALVDGRFPIARGMLRYAIDADLTRSSLARKAEVFWTDPEMVQAFLDAGADPHHIDDVASYGNSPLHYAAQAGSLEAVRLLLAVGADPTVENETGEYPRDLAARAGHDEVVAALEQAEATQPPGPSFADEPEDFDPHSVILKGSTGGLDDDALAALEARLGIRLPGEYRGFLKRFNGGVPRPARFRLRSENGSGMKCEVKRFLSVGGEASSFGEDTDIEVTRARLADWGLPRRMLPIAAADDEIEGGQLCISLRGKDRGRVVYYAPTDGGDASTTPVANSLSAFFERLGRQKDATPLWVRAIEDDDPAALGAWLASGGTLKKRYRGRSPLEIAVGEGKRRVVRWFLEQGAKPKAVFALALEAGQPAVMLELLDRDGFQPAMPASALGAFFFAPAVWQNADLIERLIDLGADVNAAAVPGQTPLMIAAQHATPEVVGRLLARGARAQVWSGQGEMALHRAACSTSRAEMLEKMRMLIDAGEDLHARAPLSALPPHVLNTARAMQTPIVDILRQGGSQVPLLGQLLESLGGDPEGSTMSFTDIPHGRTYLGQFQRTAAEFLIEHCNDAEALAELETHSLRNRTGDR